VVRRGDPAVEIARLLAECRADRLTFNRDYSPYARRRDRAVAAAAGSAGAQVVACKDRVVYEADELRTRAGGGFSVYTPFRTAWLARYASAPPAATGTHRLPRPVAGIRGEVLPAAADCHLDDDAMALPTGGEAAAQRRLDAFLDRAVCHYARDRDRP
jgi:deoxyribodipyrimidine photo-lyase